MLASKEKLRADAERSRAQLQGENLELRRALSEMQAQLLTGQRHEREHVAPLELELGRTREQMKELKHHAKVREKQFEEMLRAADGVKDEVGQLRDRLKSYDAVVDRNKALETDTSALEDRVHHLSVQLERERSERAQWARARIELLTQFCDSSANTVGIADTAATGANTDEAMLRLLATAGEPKPQPGSPPSLRGGTDPTESRTTSVARSGRDRDLKRREMTE